MSLLDQIEQQLIGRLKELEPLRREYDRLRQAAERMGIKYSPTASERPATAQRSSARASSSPRANRATATRTAGTTASSERTPSSVGERGRKARSQARASRSTSGARGSRSAGGEATARAARRRASSARPGQRREEVLRLVAERPGITVREIGERLGVDATGLYRVANRLAADGRIRKDGTGLHPIEPAPTPDTSAAADVTATIAQTADAQATDGAVAAQRPGSTDGEATAEAAAAPEAEVTEAAAADSPPAQE